MSSPLRIDFVAPPFGGHLYPQLDLACQLRSAIQPAIHFLSTPGARQAIESLGFSSTLLLSDKEHLVSGIANAPKQVGSKPWRLIGQLKDNLSMMDQLIAELEVRWRLDRPDLVIADFAVPIAGLLAQRMGIPWWTAIRAPTVIDTPDGVPPYLGGLLPSKSLVGRMRNAMGRCLIRSFKRTTHRIFRRAMLRIGVPSVYRSDGYERIYSPECILIQGVRELEFPCTWPPSATFIGPLTGGPIFTHTVPSYVADKPHVLVSLGTHVRWAKEHASDLIREVACRMPDLEFHFTRGAALESLAKSQANYHEISYLPYDQHMQRYAASIHHAGSGIMYSCLRQGVPCLAWPQDFDQFDNASRLVYHGLGVRCRTEANCIVQDLRRILSDVTMRRNLERMRATIASYRTADLVVALLGERFPSRSFPKA
jgi:UDP:flavonoid glycosyltransferase YjiC (YdhE family)